VFVFIFIPIETTTESVLVDISCNVSCGGFGWEWFAYGPSASGVREQSVGNA
jgi:hypothetical protein